MKPQQAKSTSLNPHFLQSETWEQYQKLEGHETFYLKGDDFIASGIITKTKLGNYLYCAYGPAVTDAKSLQHALEAIMPLAKEKNALFIRIEPTIVLKEEQIAKVKECKNTAGFTKHSGLAKYSGSGNAGPAKQSGSGNAKRIRLFSRTRCVYLLMCFSKS